MSTPTLVEDLEQQAKESEAAVRYGEVMGIPSGDLCARAARLRDAARRLREEMAKAVRLAGHDNNAVRYTYQTIGLILERINGGGATP